MIDYGLYPDYKASAEFAGANVCQIPVGVMGVLYDLSSDSYPHGVGEFLIIFTGSNKVQECIDFASVHWENLIPQDMFVPAGGISVDSGDDRVSLYRQDTSSNKLSYTQSEITTACKEHCEGKDFCYVDFAFHL